MNLAPRHLRLTTNVFWIRWGVKLLILLSWYSPVLADVPRIPTLQERIEECLSIAETQEQAACLARVEVDYESPTPCRRASDQITCRRLTTEALTPSCTGLEGDARDACLLKLGAELGLENSCLLLAPEFRTPCLLAAIEASGDVSVIEQQFPAGLKRDTAYSLIAGALADLSLLEHIENNERYDLGRISIIPILIIRHDQLLSDTYCDGLRGNYVETDYPEDAALNQKLCQQSILLTNYLLQRVESLETDAERDDFVRSLLENSEQIVDVISSFDLEEPVSFAGAWSCPQGTLTIEQRGSHIIGTYTGVQSQAWGACCRQGSSAPGRVRGRTMTQERIDWGDGTYSRHEVTLSEDAQGFSGTWQWFNSDGSSRGSGAWGCNR